MLPDLAASPAFYRKSLACWLCILALVFAFEAKTAWYGPAGGVGSAISAAKALPADLPQVVSHGIPAPDPVQPALPFFIFTAFVLAQFAGPDFQMTRRTNRGVPTAASVLFLSPQQFFRPPPIL
ncbi:MAG: hypothetical protein WAL75_02275 [Terracidiphilus sp.]